MPDPSRETVLVDAENVRRSRWPNLSREELVSRARDWARANDKELVIVFDGRPPERALDVGPNNVVHLGEPGEGWLAAE